MADDDKDDNGQSDWRRVISEGGDEGPVEVLTIEEAQRRNAERDRDEQQTPAQLNEQIEAERQARIDALIGEAADAEAAAGYAAELAAEGDADEDNDTDISDLDDYDELLKKPAGQ